MENYAHHSSHSRVLSIHSHKLLGLDGSELIFLKQQGIITSRVPIRKKEFGRAMSNYDETYDETYDEIIETYDEIMMKLL